jgi:hypothetical protein
MLILVRMEVSLHIQSADYSRSAECFLKLIAVFFFHCASERNFELFVCF